MISNYWKDNVKEKYASDYIDIKRIHEAHKKELAEWKKYYSDLLNEKQDTIDRLNKLVNELTMELERKEEDQDAK